MELEEWRPVVGYEGYYEVSDQGRVRSLDRTFTDARGVTRTKRARILRPYLGERYAKNTFRVDNRPDTRYVHHVVAAAFIGPRPPGFDVCHNNGDAQDNRAVNLRYDTRLENIRDTIRHGTQFPKFQTHCKRGHEYTPENTAISTKGYRRCKACVRFRWVPRSQRKKVTA